MLPKGCKNNEKRKTARKRHMEEALSCIGKMPIFSGIREEELYTLIKCCDGQMAVFEKDQWIFQAGEELGYIMVVLKGRLAIIQEDLWHQQKETIHIMPGFFRNYPFLCFPTYLSFASNKRFLQRPYIVRFIIFNRLFVPSTKPLL